MLPLVTRIFGQSADSITAWLVNYIELQHDLLVLGKLNNTLPESIVRRNGIAYLEGWDTWAQLMPVAGIGTQPCTRKACVKRRRAGVGRVSLSGPINTNPE